VYILVIRGLQAASTLPLAIPTKRVEINKDQKPVAKIVSKIPVTWQIKAMAIIRPIPIISTRGPPKTIARVKPQKAVPTIQPTWVCVSPNSETQISTNEPLVAKANAVTISAIQLALNRRVFLIESISKIF
jgi:hypothetical protein